MERAKNVRWIILFKKCDMVRVNKKCIYDGRKYLDFKIIIILFFMNSSDTKK